MSERVPVLIIGGGPVGLAAGFVLGRHGVKSVVCEQFETVNPHPRAHVVNTRSMELFRSWGIADQVAADAIDPSWLLNFSWRTEMAGEEIGRLSLAALDEADILRRMFASAEGVQSCAQDLVQGHLLQAVLDQGMVDYRAGTEVVALDSDADGVSAKLMTGGEESEITADYAIGADGALSWVRSQIGMKMRGMPPLGQQINIYFHADLTELLGDEPAILHWVINSQVRGVFIAMDGVKRWTFNMEYNPAIESVDDYPPERCADLLRKAIGADVEIDVRSVGTWTMTAETARSYNKGRVYLAGDAAHRFPPTGGLGMNTGLIDADNLAWKIAAVLNGWGGPRLLDSYQSERKPVALSNAQQSVINAVAMAGAGNGPNGAEVAARLESDDAEVAQKEREFLRAEIAKQLPHFDALNLELGFRYYGSPLVTSDGTSEYEPADPARDFDGDAQPGARLPHCELVSGGATISTQNLVGPDFVLLAGPEGAAWVDGFEAYSGPIPVRAVRIGVDVDDPNGAFADTMSIQADGCLLVRPDGHVAFRSVSSVDDPAQVVEGALRRSAGFD